MADNPAITRERSAGAVIFRRGLFGPREFLLLDYGRHWDFPKGHVEPSESDAAAARRETLEETGISDLALVDGFAREINYFFRHRKRLTHKTVIFFAARTDSATVRLSHEHVGFSWLDLSGALARLTFPASKDILQRVEEFLNAQGESPHPPDP